MRILSRGNAKKLYDMRPDIRLYDIPKSPYEKIGYARSVVLNDNGAWEAVLENAYDIIVTGEINGEDTLTFSIPYRDVKRKYIDSEKKIQIVNDIYKVRTIRENGLYVVCSSLNTTS